MVLKKYGLLGSPYGWLNLYSVHYWNTARGAMQPAEVLNKTGQT